jgi:hypothetical protein
MRARFPLACGERDTCAFGAPNTGRLSRRIKALFTLTIGRRRILNRKARALACLHGEPRRVTPLLLREKNMADGQVVLVTTEPLDGGSPVRSVYSSPSRIQEPPPQSRPQPMARTRSSMGSASGGSDPGARIRNARLHARLRRIPRGGPLAGLWRRAQRAGWHLPLKEF